MWGVTHMKLTKEQRIYILKQMVFANDNKFYRLVAQIMHHGNIKGEAITTPMAKSFLRKSEPSAARMDVLNLENKNWLSYLDDVELVHYIDFQNRFYQELKEAHCTDMEKFFKIMRKTPLGKNYDMSPDAPSLKTKYEAPTGIYKLTKDQAASDEYRNAALVDAMLESHNRKAPRGARAEVLTDAISREFEIKVEVPTITQQIKEKGDTFKKSARRGAQYAGLLNGVPIFYDSTGFKYVNGEQVSEEHYEQLASGYVENLQEGAMELLERDENPLGTPIGTLGPDGPMVWEKRDPRGFSRYYFGTGAEIRGQELELIHAGEIYDPSKDDEMAD